jgi:hypothetical protein
MPGVSIGERHELHLIAERGIFGGKASRAQVTVVGMCAEGDHSHGLILRVCRHYEEEKRNQDTRRPI